MSNAAFSKSFVLALTTCACISLTSGCNRAPNNSPAAAAEAVKKNFSAADNSAKELAQGGVTAMQGNDLPEALEKFQALAGRQDLTDQQRQTAAQAINSTLQQLAEAARNGDARAQQALKNYMMTK